MSLNEVFMRLISSSISFFLAAAYPVAIASQQVFAKPSIANQTTSLSLETALNRSDMKGVVPAIEATWENQYETYFKTKFADRAVSDLTISSTLSGIRFCWVGGKCGG